MSHRLALSGLCRSSVLAIALCTVSDAAEAQFFQSSFGLENPAAIITFSEKEFASDVLITDQFSGAGLTVSSGIFYVPEFLGSIGAGITGDHLRNASASSSDVINPVSLRFGSTQTAVAFGVATNAGFTLFEAYLNGDVVASASAQTGPFASGSSAYYGFSGISFNEVRLTRSEDDEIRGDAELYLTMDNVQLSNVASVPEPMSLVLLLTGCTLLLGRATRSRWRVLNSFASIIPSLAEDQHRAVAEARAPTDARFHL